MQRFKRFVPSFTQSRKERQYKHFKILEAKPAIFGSSFRSIFMEILQLRSWPFPVLPLKQLKMNSDEINLLRL